MGDSKSKKLAIILGAVVLVILILVGLWFGSGVQVTKARCVVTDNGTVIMVYNNRPVVLNGIEAKDYQTGDELLIFHANAFAESYPEQVRAHKAIRLNEGTKDDIPKEVLDVLIEMDFIVPFTKEEFSFAFTFGYYGNSSYNSNTGKLIKNNQNAGTMQLSEEAIDEIYQLLCDLDIQSYPDVYDPVNDPNSDGWVDNTMPTTTFILTVTTSEWTKTVTCEDITSGLWGYDEPSKAFMNVCKEIQILIKSTDEWKALPDVGGSM